MTFARRRNRVPTRGHATKCQAFVSFVAIGRGLTCDGATRATPNSQGEANGEREGAPQRGFAERPRSGGEEMVERHGGCRSLWRY